MKAPSLHELTARVVAWHNRHPLARRIDATQVHSIGAVRLPFASATAWGSAGAAAADGSATNPPAAAAAAPAAAPAAATPQGPSLADALAQRSARQQAAGANSPEPAGLHDADMALLDSSSTAGAGAADIDLDLGDAATPSAAAETADTADTASAQPGEPDGDQHSDPDGGPDGALASDAAAQASDVDDGDDGEAALVIPLLDGDDSTALTPNTDTDPVQPPQAPDAADTPGQRATPLSADPTLDPSADPLQAPDDSVYPPPHGVVPASSLARAVERRAAARQAQGLHGSDDGAAFADVSDLAGPDTAAPAASGWRRLLAALRSAWTGRQAGMPPLRAAFSREFIWPLWPGQVARWAQRHGAPQALAPADWPRRSIAADRNRLARLRQKGLAHDVPLHVLTAAIGVGDRRLRVLVGADGSILGPRAFHPSRVGAVCTVLAIGLVGLGWGLRPLTGLQHSDDAAALAALAASAASAPLAPLAPLAAASAADAGASAAQLAHAASAGASAAESAASQAEDYAQALAQADAQSAAADAAAAAAGPAASAATDRAAEASTLAALAKPAARVATAAASGPAPDIPAATGAEAASQPPASIRPVLSDEARQAARLESARLRGQPIAAAAPPAADAAALLQGPVYAVVSLASPQRETAASNLLKMKSAASRLDGTAPDHGELLQSQGQWRAAWWPFTSLVDAERARVLLAGRGVKAEVVEF